MTIALAISPRPSRTQLFFRATGIIGLGLTAIAVAWADFIARMPAGLGDARFVSLPPSGQLPFGTDVIGRDVLSETLHGFSLTAEQAAVGALIAVAFGHAGGFFVARLRFHLGDLLRWIAEVLCEFPALVIAILLVAITHRSMAPFAAGFAVTPVAFARSFDRARTLLAAPHAEFARATGVYSSTLLRRDLVHEFRNRLASIFGHAIAAVAIILSTLSFVGFGAAPPHRDLGLMIAGAFANAHATHNYTAWWAVLFPSLALTFIVLCAKLAAIPDETT